MLLLGLGSCTAIKPLVCTFTYPVDNMRERLAAPRSDDDPEDLPPIPLLVAAPIIIPVRFVSEALVGLVSGLVSGVVSDLNVITGNFSSATRNLTKPFKTNAQR